MQKVFWITGLLMTLILETGWQVVQAASGLPTSAQFGYGVRVKLAGESVNSLDQVLRSAARSGQDWIALDFDWATQAPSQEHIDLAVLDTAMELAKQNSLQVLLSITHAPSWSLTTSGPNAEFVSTLIVALGQRYPGTLLAVELFPAANTTQGWGATPDPQAYVRLLNTTQTGLRSARLDITLIAAGLTHLPVTPAPGDINDLVFLTGLYDAGGRDNMPVIGIRLPVLTGDPLAAPVADGSPCLRHFEAIRQVMLDHGHERGLIWISGFTWPTELNTPCDNNFSDCNHTAQDIWLVQAYELMQAHLYIGAAFFDSLNATDGSPALLTPTGAPHIGLIHLAQSITSRQASIDGQTTYVFKRFVLRKNFKPYHIS